MTYKIAVIIDPIDQLNPKKDTSLGLIAEMQQRGWQVSILGVNDLLWQQGSTWLQSQVLQPFALNGTPTYDLGAPKLDAAENFDAIVMRKDPPFNMHYVDATYLLDAAEQAGVVVVNPPSSIRAANEKLFATLFANCMPETLVTSKPDLIRQFAQQKQHIVVKPLHGMGGNSIFQINASDPNLAVIIETITKNATELVMAQKFIKEIKQSGDKRIIMIDGEPAPYALARIPASGDFRGNLAAGASAHGVELTERDHWLCQQVGPSLRERGLWLVGLDVIGDYITEINVTSPTCLRELEQQYQVPLIKTCIDRLQLRIEENNGNR